MKIGDNVYVHGYVDEIRKDIVIIRNEGGYFGTVPSEIICGEMLQPEPQIIYSKAGYIMSLHKEYGCTLTRAEEAHNKALEYLRDKAMMKG